MIPYKGKREKPPQSYIEANWYACALGVTCMINPCPIKSKQRSNRNFLKKMEANGVK